MIRSASASLNFEEYVTWCQQTDEHYELFRGELVSVVPPSIAHHRIAKFLERFFDAETQQRGTPWEAFREMGQRTERNTARLPDVLVANRYDLQTFDSTQPAILEVPALLVVEIVSGNWRDDYYVKFSEYEALGISEYWIVDYAALGGRRLLGNPKQPTVIVCTLVDGEYQMRQFVGDALIESVTFPDIQLTAQQIFDAALT